MKILDCNAYLFFIGNDTAKLGGANKTRFQSVKKLQYGGGQLSYIYIVQ